MLPSEILKRLGLDKSLNDVRAETFENLDEKHAEYSAQGFLPVSLNLNRGLIRGLIELFNWGLWKLYQFMAWVMAQAFPIYSSGAWLDEHARQIVLTRKPALQAKGEVIFYREKTEGNLKIPTGRLLRTKPDGLGQVYRFVTTAEAVMPEGQKEILVPVMAENYGRGANVGPGMICELVTGVLGIDGVTNEDDWLTTEGAEIETDESLITRYVLAWQSVGGLNKYFYKALAMSVPGVIDAQIAEQHPRGQGTVDIIVRGAAGVPTANLINQVTAVVEAERPQNDKVLVKAPQIINADCQITLEISQGKPEKIQAEVESRLRALFVAPATLPGVPPLQIGEDLTHSRLIHEAMKSSGVKKVIITKPPTDLTVPDGGLAVLTNLIIKTEQVAD